MNTFYLIVYLLTLVVLTYNVWLMRDFTRFLITLVREIKETIRWARK